MEGNNDMEFPGTIKAILAKREDITSHLAHFSFKLDQPFPFEPGQYAMIVVDNEGRPLQRAYSIYSSPDTEFLEFLIELVDHGQMTPKLWKLQVNDVVNIRERAAGRFSLDKESGKTNHLFVATVTGTAPFHSMIMNYKSDLEKGIATEKYKFALLVGVSDPTEVNSFDAELKALASEVDWLTYVPTVSRPWDAPAWSGEIGRVDEILRKYADQLGFTAENTIAYACGNPTMISNVQGITKRMKFAEGQCKEEKYYSVKPTA